MNAWRCEHPGCTNSCVGLGGAIGLRAIGWYFYPVKSLGEPFQLFCPIHRPEELQAFIDSEVNILQEEIRKSLGIKKSSCL